MSTQNKSIVLNFIEEIWNKNRFDKLNDFIHPSFKDYSTPEQLPAGSAGLEMWIMETGKSFEHRTIIEESAGEGNTVMLRIKMQLKHTGKWRDIEPTGAEINTVGYRCFKLSGGLITEHYALIDGNAIEKQLLHTNHGCKIQG